jgi:hypothetical protein
VAEKAETFDTKPENKLVNWDFGNDGRRKEIQGKMELGRKNYFLDRLERYSNMNLKCSKRTVTC